MQYLAPTRNLALLVTASCLLPRSAAVQAPVLASDVPAPVITLSLLARFRSRQEESLGAKVIAALRNEFGGHAVQTK